LQINPEPNLKNSPSKKTGKNILGKIVLRKRLKGFLRKYLYVPVTNNGSDHSVALFETGFGLRNRKSAYITHTQSAFIPDLRTPKVCMESSLVGEMMITPVPLRGMNLSL
jgi:hypothetical protein